MRLNFAFLFILLFQGFVRFSANALRVSASSRALATEADVPEPTEATEDKAEAEKVIRKYFRPKWMDEWEEKEPSVRAASCAVLCA